jgi:acyl dehydratase
MSALEIEVLRARIDGAAGPSPWIVIDQTRIDAFANCTGDTYWLHTDSERARAEGSFGTTIAHGFLLLSLLAGHGALHLEPLPGVAHVLNYGVDRLRFLTPVRVGEQVRIHTRIEEFAEKEPGRWLLRQEKRIEVREHTRPALIATQLVLFLMASGI